METKNPKKLLSSALVFASVFMGSIMGAGITMLSSPTSGKEFRKKIKGTFSVLKSSVDEQFDTASLIVIENSAQVITKTKIRVGDFNSYLSKIKEKIKLPPLIK